MQKNKNPTVYFISDLHLFHANILKFSPMRGGHDMETHAEWIVSQINSVCSKRDILYILGDVVFKRGGLEYLKMLNPQIHLILGNHDRFQIDEYLDHGVASIKPGLWAYKGFWLSHAPIHPDELRGRKNVHGHVHDGTIPDDRYINVCVEPLGGLPISLAELKDRRRNCLSE